MPDNFSVEEYKRELYQRSLDTIRVHNPTDQDIVFWWDKKGPKAQKIMVPSGKRNIGKGRGNQDMPRYLAEYFTQFTIEKIITKRSHNLWEKEKKKYSREERAKFEERYGLRTNDREQWKELYPKIWLGIIERYGGEELPEPDSPETRPTDRDLLKSVSEELNLADKEYEEKDSQDIPNKA